MTVWFVRASESALIASVAFLLGTGALSAQRPAALARDTTTPATAGSVDGAFIDRLPVDSINGALQLQSNVGGSADGLVIRGGEAGAAGTFIDGIPITPGSRRVRLQPGTNALSEASVLSGPLSAALGNGTAGAILLRTRTRGPARFSYESDSPFGASSLGLNRFEASGGISLGHLTFFGAGVLQGQRSAEPGFHAGEAPIFVRAGIDTTVTVGNTPVDVYDYAVSRGSCDAFAGSVNAGIAGNYGVACQGDRTPFSDQSNHQLLAKVEYGSGQTRIGVMAMRSRDQSRLFNYATSQLITNTFGQSTTSDLLGLTLAQRLGQGGVFRASLSRQSDRLLGGPLNPAGELATRNPSLGILVGEIGYSYDFNTFPVDSQLVYNYRNNVQGSRRSPYDLGNTPQYVPISNFRSNAYGLTGTPESGGPIGLIQLYREHRTVGTANGTWQVGPNSRFQIGGELTRYDIDNYHHQLTSQAGSDVYKVSPSVVGLFAEDVFHYGSVTFSAGVRYDRLNSNAMRPFSLDTVAASPTFNTYQPFPRISSYDGTFDGDSLVVFKRDKSHSAVSPRFRLAYGVSAGTEFRLGYSRQAQLPDFGTLFAGLNTDLAITNTNQVFGSDMGFEKSWIAEAGLRHALGNATTLDLSAYVRRDDVTLAARLVPLQDPTRHNAQTDLREFTEDNGYHTEGADIRLERRQGALTGTVGYSLQHSRVSGSGVAGPFSRPHALSAALAFGLRNTTLLAGARLASGAPYSSCDPLGNESVLSDEACVRGGGIAGARLPMEKLLDLRLTQDVHIGAQTVTAYIDARNILNFRNVVRVYSTTGTTTSPLEAETDFANDSSSAANEAKANGIYDVATGAVDLGFAGQGNSGCAGYVTQAGSAAAPSCIELIRAEQRFGNGDGVFTLAEQHAAFGAAYAASHGEQVFTGAPRRMRVGVQIGF
jgi:TonB-dependent receptor-like protein